MLHGVALVGEAEIDVETVELAERVVRPFIRSASYDHLADVLRATYSVFVVIRGAEVYTGNSLWPGLGVPEQDTSTAGQAFLVALRRLWLPDFQEMVRIERARTYVAPILIHGGVPASAVPRLLTQLEEELRRGVIDGEDAARRLVAGTDAIANLGRPTVRLLKQAPRYAGQLLDSLIDRLEARPDRPPHRLPPHIERALEQRRSSAGQASGRVPIPRVEFDPWSGAGPEVVMPDSPILWTIFQDGEPLRLEQGERAEVSPGCAVDALSKGRRVTLLRGDVSWFDEGGRAVAVDAPLPRVGMVLRPAATAIVAGGGEIGVLERYAPPSGEWSGYQAELLDLGAADFVSTSNDARSRPVRRETGIELIGAPVASATALGGQPVFARCPEARVASEASLSVWFTPQGRRTRFSSLQAVNGLVSLADLVGTEPVIGTLELRAGDQRSSTSFAFAPGLEVQAPSQLVGLDEPVTIWVRSSIALINDTMVTIAAGADDATLRVAESPDVMVRILAPRVKWALRTSLASRLSFTSCPIAASLDDLLAAQHWIVVRASRVSSPRLELWVGDAPHQSTTGKVRKVGECEWQTSFNLGPLADSMRHRSAEHLTLRLVIDDQHFVILESGSPARFAPGARVTSAAYSLPRSSTSVQSRHQWAGVRWMQDPEPTEAPSSRHQTQRLLSRLAPLDKESQITEFCRMCGEQPRDAVALAEVAQDLWRLDGVRYREWAQKDLARRMPAWAREHGTSLKNWSFRGTADRNALELWTLRHAPAIERFDDWDVVKCLADPFARAQSGVERLPAIVLFHVLALSVACEESALALAEVVDLAPEVLLESLALLVELARQGIRVPSPPPTTVIVDEEVPQTSVPASPAPVRLGSLQDVDAVSVDGHILLETSSSADYAVLRVWSGTPAPRPLALVRAERRDGSLDAALPQGVCGDLHVSVVPAIDSVEFDRFARPVTAPCDEWVPPKVGATRSVDDLHDLSVSLVRLTQAEDLLRRIVDALAAGRLPATEIEALFDDEDVATRALIALTHSAVAAIDLDRVAAATAPSSLLFSGLPMTTTEAAFVFARSPMLWAALAPHDPGAWRRAGWPNAARFDAGAGAYEDLIAFGRSVGVEVVDEVGHRYELRGGTAPLRRLSLTLRELERRGPGEQCLNLAVAAFVAASNDVLAVEATRRTLEAIEHERRSTGAFLLGVAAAHAVSEASRLQREG
jgi:hypothetical protein